MKDLLYIKKIVYNNRIVAIKIETCLFRETEKKTICFCDPIKPRESFMFSLFWLSSAAFCDSVADIVQKSRSK